MHGKHPYPTLHEIKPKPEFTSIKYLIIYVKVDNQLTELYINQIDFVYQNHIYFLFSPSLTMSNQLRSKNEKL